MESDKHYWHGYVSEYERLALSKLEKPTDILEIGVGQGNSIQWLSQRFPEANIVGADCASSQPQWPTSPRIKYVVVDQGSRNDVKEMFGNLFKMFDLIIDDGSHNPQHQADSLLTGMTYLKSGGFYILEDVHSCYSREEPFNPLHLLLALLHFREAQLSIDDVIAKLIKKNTYFSEQDIRTLNHSISEIHFYRRAKLPIKCWHCLSTDFDYVQFKCVCGTNLLSEADSMAFILRKNT